MLTSSWRFLISVPSQSDCVQSKQNKYLFACCTSTTQHRVDKVKSNEVIIELSRLQNTSQASQNISDKIQFFREGIPQTCWSVLLHRSRHLFITRLCLSSSACSPSSNTRLKRVTKRHSKSCTKTQLCCC